MSKLNELLQTADWKTEKHVPVIDVPEVTTKGKAVCVTVTVGKEVAHPNKAEHHIAWIEVFFQQEGEKFPYQIGKADFLSHGASTQGTDTSSVYTNPEITLSFKTEKSGAIYALSYCNIHGLWQNSKNIKVE